jgi:hypothetical protein
MPRANPKRPSCSATNASGDPCGMPPLEGSRFCFAHDPRRGKDRAQARKRGGHNRQTPGATDELREAVSLDDVAGIRRILTAVVADTIAQANSAQRSRAIGYLLGVALKALEVGELEERLEALEQRIAEVFATKVA